MHLSKVVIRNYRAIREASVEFDNYNVVIGKNDAGKSSLLQAIRKLLEFDTLDHAEFRDFDESNTVTLYGEFTDIPEPLAETLDDEHFDSEALQVTVRHEQSKRSSGVPDTISINGVDPDEIVTDADGARQARATLRDHFPDPIEEAAERSSADETQLTRNSWLTKLLDPVFDDDRFEEEISSIQEKFGSKVTEFKDEGNLNSTLSNHNPAVDDVRITPDEINIRRAFATNIEVRDSRTGEWMSLSERGSGVGNQFILSMMRTYAEMNLEGEFAVIFEEPENSLHPTAVREMCSIFNELAQDDKQIILSTHSQTLINVVDDGNIILTRRGDAGYTNYEVLDENLQTAIEEIGARPSDILQSDYVLYVEGPTDKAVVETILANIDYDLELSLTVHAAGGSNLLHQLDNLNDLSQSCSLLLDRDANNPDEMGSQTRRIIDRAEEEDIPYEVLDRVQLERYFDREILDEYYEDDEIDYAEYGSRKEAIRNTTTGYNAAEAQNIAELAYEEFEGLPDLEAKILTAISKGVSSDNLTVPNQHDVDK